MRSHFYPIDWVVLGCYFASTVAIGIAFYRRTRSTVGYTAANRSLPGWVCGLSIFATFVSSISYLALPGGAFATNWNAFVFSLSMPLVTWIAVRYFLPYYRQSGEVSAYALLERRFGLWARLYASAFYLLTQIARIAVVLYLMALPMQTIFGWSIVTTLIVTGVCVTLYSFVGGILAVIWTDALQAIVLMAGAVVSLLVMCIRTPGGPPRILETALAHDKLSLGSFAADFAGPTFWVVLLYGITINLQNFGIDQSYIQRYIASRTDAEARRGLWLGGLLYVPISALFLSIGTSLFVYYDAEQSDAAGDVQEVREIVARQRLLRESTSPQDADFAVRQKELAAALTLEEVGDRVFPHFIAKHLPPGVTGLLIAAIFAAAMSTVSTSLNSSATLIMSDYYRRLIRPDATERQLLRVLYGATLLWGALGTGLALWLVKLTESALDIWWTLAGMLGGGVTGLFLLGFVSRHARNISAALGVITGVLVISWLSLPKLLEYMLKLPTSTALHRLAQELNAAMEQWSSPLHAYMVPVLGTLTIFTIGSLLSICGRRGQP